MKLSKSKKLLSKANNLIGHQTMTMSKRTDQFVEGVYPAYVESGNGFVLKDVDGNSYIDFVCGLGSILLGYNHPKVNEAIKNQLKSGSLFSLPHRIEIQFAEAVHRLFPYMEKIRVLKTGSEAVSAAIRIARTYTRRDRVVSCSGYHGWHDCAMHKPPANGVPGDIRALISILGEPVNFDEVAALIIEPILLEPPKDSSGLKFLRDLCTKHGVVLIFDEIITGMRVPNYSVANWYGITPDLSCFGKAMGNGMPIAVVGGKRDLMDADYFVSSTYGGETLSMAAALAVIKEMNPQTLNRFWYLGDKFRERFNHLNCLVTLRGYNTRGQMDTSDDNYRALFWQEMVRHGVLFGKAWFLSISHDKEILDRVLDTCAEVSNLITQGKVELEGKIPKEAIKRD